MQILALLVFPAACTLAAGSKAKFTYQARFTDTLSLLSGLDAPGVQNQVMKLKPQSAGDPVTSSAAGDVTSLDFGGLGGEATTVGSDAAADAVSDSIRSLFNMPQQAQTLPATKPVAHVKAAAAKPVAPKQQPPTAKVVKANAAPKVQQKHTVKVAAAKAVPKAAPHPEQTKKVKAAAPAKVAPPPPKKASAPKAAVAVAKPVPPRKANVQKPKAVAPVKTPPKQAAVAVAPKKKTVPKAVVAKPKTSPPKQQVPAPVAPKRKKAVAVAVAPAPKKLKAEKAPAVAAAPVVPTKKAPVAKKAAPPAKPTKKHVASMAVTRVDVANNIQAAAAEHALEVSRQEARREKEVQLERERNLEEEVYELQAKLATTTAAPAKVVKTLAATQVETARLPPVAKVTAAPTILKKIEAVTPPEMTMTMVPSMQAVPATQAPAVVAEAEAAPAAPLGFWGSIGHWFHTLWFGPDPTPVLVAPTPPAAPDPNEGRPPFSRQDIEHTADAAREDGLADAPIADEWERKEKEDISLIDQVKREDRALRLDAETPKKPALPAPLNFRHDKGSTHISHFWRTLAEEDAEIENALTQDGEDLSEYERLKKLQDAKVVASVSEISGPIGDHLALERRQRLRRAASAA